MKKKAIFLEEQIVSSNVVRAAFHERHPWQFPARFYCIPWERLDREKCWMTRPKVFLVLENWVLSFAILQLIRKDFVKKTKLTWIHRVDTCWFLHWSIPKREIMQQLDSFIDFFPCSFTGNCWYTSVIYGLYFIYFS